MMLPKEKQYNYPPRDVTDDTALSALLLVAHKNYKMKYKIKLAICNFAYFAEIDCWTLPPIHCTLTFLLFEIRGLRIRTLA